MKEVIGNPYEDLNKFARTALNFLKGDESEIDNWNEVGCGIVYCRTRNGCDEVASHLSRLGMPSKPYHAGLKNDVREEIQSSWMEGNFPIIAATISFGMGVDKANVRFVAHWTLPKSMAGYYQESGRAGRDGKKSYCRLYYARHERDTVAFLIQKETTRFTRNDKAVQAEKQKAAQKSFEALVKYCEEQDCRHWAIARYFGDVKPECEGACDVCKEPKKVAKAVHDLQTGSYANFNNKRGSGGIYFYEDGDDDDDDPGLYGGGRRGAKSEYENYSRSFEDGADDDDSAAYRREKKEQLEKKQRHNFIMKEFKKRKGGFDDSSTSATLEEPDEEPDPDCPLRDAANHKIPKLTIKGREYCMGMLEKALKDNFCQYYQDVPHKLVGQDYEPRCSAIDLEYDLFKVNKMANIYKAAVMRTTNEIKKCTSSKDLHVSLIQKCAMSASGDLKSSPTDSSPLVCGFTTASDMFSSSLVEETDSRSCPPKPAVFVSAADMLRKDNRVKKSDPPLPSLWRPDLNSCDSDENSKSPVCVEKVKDENQASPSSSPGLFTTIGKSVMPNTTLTKPSVSHIKKEPKHSGFQKASSVISKEVKFDCDKGKSSNSVKSKSGKSKDKISKNAPQITNFFSKRCVDEEDSVGNGDLADTKVIKKEVIDSDPMATNTDQEVAKSDITFEPCKTECDVKLVDGEELLPEVQAKPCQKRKMDDKVNESRSKKSRMASDMDTTKTNQSSASSENTSTSREASAESSRPSDGRASTRGVSAESRKVAADLVVKYLTPHYKGGRIPTKDTFKSVARALSHKVIEKPGGTGKPEKVKEIVKKVIENLFKKVKLVKSVEDLVDV